MIQKMAMSLLATIIIEYVVLLLLGEKRKRILYSSVLVNTLTNVPLCAYLLLTDSSFIDVIIGELLVVIIEAIWYYILLRDRSQALIYSLLCNAISFLTGLLVQYLWIYIYIIKQ